MIMMKNMKIKFDANDELPLNKAIKIPVMVIVVRAVFHENDKYYSYVFLGDCLYKLWKCFFRTELTLLKEMMLIRHVHQKSVIFVTIGIS